MLDVHHHLQIIANRNFFNEIAIGYNRELGYEALVDKIAAGPVEMVRGLAEPGSTVMQAMMEHNAKHGVFKINGRMIQRQVREIAEGIIARWEVEKNEGLLEFLEQNRDRLIEKDRLRDAERVNLEANPLYGLF